MVDGSLPACGCGWMLPEDVMVRVPQPGPDDDPVVVVVWCPRCDTPHEIEMGGRDG